MGTIRKHSFFLAFFLMYMSMSYAQTTTPQIRAGNNYNVVLKSDGSVWTWGINSYGQLGVGDVKLRALPTQITDINNVIAVSPGGFHVLALKQDGSVWAWGANRTGQLGQGTDTDVPVVNPVRVKGLSKIVSIAAGNGHSLALRSDGTVWVWGGNWVGQLGLGEVDQVNLPTQLPGLTNVKAIYVGFWHNIAVKTDGTVWTWGDNTAGDLGLGDIDIRKFPTQLFGFDDAVEFFLGDSSFALKADGSVWAWGGNIQGQLGLGEADLDKCFGYPCSITPRRIEGLNNIIGLASGGNHSLAVSRDGSVWSWGGDFNGELGLRDTPLEHCFGWFPYKPCGLKPRKIDSLNSVASVSAGFNHSEALKSDGSLWTWGSNDYRELGLKNAVTDPCVKTPCKYSPNQVQPWQHVASQFTINPVDFGSISRSPNLLNQSDTLTVQGTMPQIDFDPTHISVSKPLAVQFEPGTCISGSLSGSCNFSIALKAWRNIGPQHALLAIPASDTFVKATLLPVYATVNGGHLFMSDKGTRDYGQLHWINGETLSKRWTFVNLGNESVVIKRVTLASPDSPANFAYATENCSFVLLAPQQKCSVTVVFFPQSAGKKTVNLIVYSNDPVFPKYKVELTGEGID